MDGVIVDAQSNGELIEQIERLNSNWLTAEDPATGRMAVCIGDPIPTLEELCGICRPEKKA